MIQRINLIERQAWSFTYQNLLQICAVVVIVNIFFVGFQFFRIRYLQPKIATAQIEMDELNAANTQLTATTTTQPVKRKVSIGEFQPLFDALDAIPDWAHYMRVVTNSLPNSVWINTFKSTGPPSPAGRNLGAKIENATLENQSTTPTTTVPILAPRVEISGTGVDIKGVADFMSALEKSKLFDDLALVNTLKQDYGYQFTLQGDVVLENAK